MKSLALIEYDFGGHHLIYLQRIVRAATLQGILVIVFTSHKSKLNDLYKSLQFECGDLLQTIYVEKSITDKIEQSSNINAIQLYTYLFFLNCASLIRKLPVGDRPEVVFVPFIDTADKAIALLGSPFGKIPWAGLTMKNLFHLKIMGAKRPQQRQDGLNKWLYSRLLKSPKLVALFTIDELLTEYTSKFEPRLFYKVHYVADPADLKGSSTRETARSAIGLTESGSNVILVFGAIHNRKGLQTLLDASKLPAFPSNCCIVLAGKHSRDAVNIVSNFQKECPESTRIIQIDKFLTQEEEFQVFKAADIVWVSYIGFYGMSGVLIQAAMTGLPVVASKSGLVGWMTEKYELGISVDEYSAHEAAHAITKLVNDPNLRERYGKNGQVLAESHTAATFTETVLTNINSGLTSTR